MKRRKAFISVFYHLSVILLPLGCFFSAACSGNHSLRQQQLNDLQAQNQADTVFRSDSLQKILVDHFNRHGTANEKMLANYLLGRAYYDMGETPLALHYYHEAIDRADTTAADCDFKVLSCVHGQAASLLLRKGAPQDAIEQFRKASTFAMLEGDTLMALACENNIGSAYEKLNNIDSALLIVGQTYDKYLKYGYKKQAQASIGGIIDILIRKGYLSEAREMMSRYESSGIVFDSCHEVKKGKIIYYYTKGLYYLKNNQIDSALYHFRKLQNRAITTNHLECAYEGLSRSYNMLGINDSTVKYALLAYELNDSCHREKMTADYQHSQAMYRYTRQQQLAEHNAIKAEQEKTKTILTFILLLITMVVCGSFIYRHHNTIKQLREKLKAFSAEKLKIQKEIAQLQTLYHSASESLAEKDTTIVSLIADKKRNAAELTRRIAVLESQLGLRRMDETKDVCNMGICTELRKQLNHPSPEMSTSQWKTLEVDLDKAIPRLPTFLDDVYPDIRLEEKKVIYLTRVGMKTRQIGKLMGINSDSTISSMKERLLPKVFGIKGGTKLFTQLVLDIY